MNEADPGVYHFQFRWNMICWATVLVLPSPQPTTTLLELQTKVHTKVRNHGEGPYSFSWLKVTMSAFTFNLRHY